MQRLICRHASLLPFCIVHFALCIPVGLALWVVIGIVGLTAGGQTPNQGQPSPRTTALVPPLFLPDDQYLRWPLLPSESVYGKLKGDHIKALMKEVTAISHKSRDDGNQYWGRITGTPYDAETQQWALRHFRRIGLEQIRTQELDLRPQWMPASWEGSVHGGGKSVELKTLFPIFGSRGTPSGGLELEPVWVGFGTGADYLGRDMKGKAAFIYSTPTPGGRNFSARWNGAIERAEKLGAAAIVVVMGVPGNVTSQPAGEGAGGISAVPQFTVGSQDGTAVREMLEQGFSPKVRLRLNVNMTAGLKTANVWGVLPGMTDENILVMAHSDSFFEGALDNASGMAGLVALAEYYAAMPKAARRRTLTFLVTPGHHAGDPGVRWIHNNRDTVLAKTALILNCEHFSQTQTYWLGPNLMPSNTVSARRWYVGGGDALKAIVAQAFHTFGVAIYSRPEDRPGGSLSQVYQDAPSLHVIDHIYYHTDMDVAELVPDTGLEAVARAFAKILDEVNKVDIRNLRAETTGP